MRDLAVHALQPARGLRHGTTLLSVLAYRGLPLSLGPVLEATSYLYVTFFGVTIFHEKMNCKKLLALALILAGIVVSAAAGGTTPLHFPTFSV